MRIHCLLKGKIVCNTKTSKFNAINPRYMHVDEWKTLPREMKCKKCNKILNDCNAP